MKYGLFIVTIIVSLFAVGILSQSMPYWQLSIRKAEIIPTEVKKFSSYNELVYFISRMRNLAKSIYGEIGVFGEGLERSIPAPTPVPMPPMPEGYTAEVKVPYSKTNVQVEEVDEPDIVKIDGKYMYLCSLGKKTVFILEIYPPDKASLLSTINISGYPIGLFLYEDTLIIFYTEGETIIPKIFREEVMHENVIYPNTTLLIVDVGDPGKPTIKHKLVFEGEYVGSRLIDNFVYLIVQTPLYDEKPRLPSFHVDKYSSEIRANKISYAEIASYSYNLLTVFSVDVKTASVKYDSFLFPYASVIYVSRNNMYITTTKITVKEERYLETTLIYKVRIEDGEVSVVAYGEVLGRLLNQFSMDEYNGYFRIATTVGEGWRTSEMMRNNVYVLNETLDVVGKLEGLGIGERIYGVRFMGEVAFIVTFRVMDPLFIIDLSDPESPRVIGELKIPGYSAYLHPITKDLLLGIGMEIEVRDSATRVIGVKISLFNVSNLTKPIEVSKLVLEKGSTSPVLHEHKAFLYYPEKKLAFIPILPLSIIVSNKELYYKKLVYQEIIVVRINIESQKLELVGNITQMKYIYDEDITGYYIGRTAYVGEYLYTISNKLVTIHDLNTLKLIKMVELIT